MSFQDMFREEFYEELKDYPASLVIKSIKLMSKPRMSSFYLYYKKGSTASLDSSVAKELINNLKDVIDKNFSKLRFSQVFKNYKIETVKQKFEELNLNAQVSLLKEYTFNEVSVEYKINVIDKDTENNKNYLLELSNKLKTNISKYKPFYENFHVSREILLLAIILLDEKDKEYLIMKYDENLCRSSRKEGVSSEIIQYVSLKVMPKIKKNIDDITSFIPYNILETLKSMLNVINTSQIFTNYEMINRITTLISDYIYKMNFYEIFSNINKELLNNLLIKLTSKEKSTLKKEYSFDSIVRKNLLNEEEKNLNRETIKKLKEWINLYQNYTNLYQFFEESEDIDNKIEHLPLEDNQFLLKMYNQGLSNEPNINMIIYKENLGRLEIIIRKVKKIVNIDNEKHSSKEKIILDIFDIVRIKDLNQIKHASQKLHILEYMKVLFGENLDKEIEINVSSLGKFITSPFIYKLNSLLENKTVQRQSISIYEYYISYKREDESIEDFKQRLNDLIEKIDSKKVRTALLNRFYNDVKDLSCISELEGDNTNLSNANLMITNKLALQNLYYAREKGLDYKEPIFNRKTILLIEHFYEGISLNDIKRELEFYNERTINLFKLKFGENLDELGKVGIFESKDLELMQRVINKINKKLYLKDLLLNLINKFKTTTEFAILKENYSSEDSLIIMSEKYLKTYISTKEVQEYLSDLNVYNKRLG